MKKMNKTPIVQPQPQTADIVPKPDPGEKDASTGQLKSVIKEGTDFPLGPTISAVNDLSGGGGRE